MHVRRKMEEKLTVTTSHTVAFTPYRLCVKRRGRGKEGREEIEKGGRGEGDENQEEEERTQGEEDGKEKKRDGGRGGGGRGGGGREMRMGRKRGGRR
jgi:hypothetical protein